MFETPLTISPARLADQLEQLISFARENHCSFQMRQQASATEFDVLMTPPAGRRHHTYYRGSELHEGGVHAVLDSLISSSREMVGPSPIEVTYDVEEIAEFVCAVSESPVAMLSFQADFRSERDPVFHVWIGGKGGTATSNNAHEAILQAWKNAKVGTRPITLPDPNGENDWHLSHHQTAWMSKRS